MQDRDYIQDILFQVTRLTTNQNIVFSFENYLLFIEIVEAENFDSLVNYNTAYNNLKEFLNLPAGGKLHLRLAHKNVMLIHAESTWVNRFKARKIYVGKLPEYKE